MTKRLLLALAAMVAVLVPAAPAWAHNALADASPAKNATLKKAPAEVELRFLESLDADSTKLTVKGASVSEPTVKGATVSVTFTEPPANGEYTVEYQVKSTDGHTTKGSYTFTVAAPVPRTSPSPSSEASSPAPVATSTAETLLADDSGPSDRSNAGGSGLGLGLAAGIGILALAGAAGFVLYRRRAASK
ncbi:copper resistance CopC family protein [Actinoplanes sp. NPDC051851]|uniref:copper resistance CopC family protein n=1 Tax=Actinoplanes sp. NPDC051851 TaxID=3154753 RepID=UPI0034278A6D